MREILARWGAVLALAVFAPVSVDVVFGATPVSVPTALVPEILTYGVAAVLVRDVVRAGRRSVAAVVVLGVAFAVVSECLVVQTSVAPDPGLGGRFAGVNAPYLVFMLGYIAVWAFLLPIRVVETALPARAGRAWLGRPGRIALAVLFVLGCLDAWFTWTRIVRPFAERLPVYDPPWPVLAGAALAALVLVVVALALPRGPVPWPAPRRAPAPVVVGVVPVVVLGVWVVTTVGAPPGLPVAAGIAIALLVAAGTAVLFAAWVRGPGWSPRHRTAAMLGAVVANSAAGFVVVGHYTPVDLVGKIVVDVVVLVLVGWAATRDPAARTSPERNTISGRAL